MVMLRKRTVAGQDLRRFRKRGRGLANKANKGKRGHLSCASGPTEGRGPRDKHTTHTHTHTHTHTEFDRIYILYFIFRYDILNQRYVIRRNERRGTVQKLLRLAVGTRSQLCPVHDNFKVVVVVEQQHAYVKLS